MEHTKDAELALVARLRLARVQIAQKKPDAALATLNGLKAGAFEPRYHEVLGDAYYAKGDKADCAEGIHEGESRRFRGLARYVRRST